MSLDDDRPAVRWGASLLFLASWACNDYFPRFGGLGSYVNSTMFRIIGQAYSGDMPVHITIPARRRDGETLDGGYEHGEVTFNLPVQCSIGEPASFDEDFLAGLSAAVEADSEVAGLLRTTLPFVELASSRPLESTVMTLAARPVNFLPRHCSEQDAGGPTRTP